MISSSASERAETASAATEADASTAAAHEATKGTRGKQYFFSRFPIYINSGCHVFLVRSNHGSNKSKYGLMLISYKNLTSGFTRM